MKGEREKEDGGWVMKLMGDDDDDRGGKERRATIQDTRSLGSHSFSVFRTQQSKAKRVPQPGAEPVTLGGPGPLVSIR
ncbi:uncharacterized protein BP01DRAFT_357821 [Aspergillus saccharolyticus JOP 1030-1]|uniref:Uncharacterized protein n=1 Tax=Aspergillus saccharolyticus JOP 1030-1 TaxID=1450539 RepID=A0A318ZCF1_9EURO|nr:hypothetical protein BP01DRAFT_357821 [Aspergillus saccharolyticus JOP 1030-1]PYH44207.1 hypothetical protein BP01DRAFT_357821 [Aspergillus saccharolyticus JOP 1030-1]